ncbi:hypothetical protein BKA82DRAFT_1000254 [Pisolithus tinctorius]|uniref:Uncharacterized protein n=1 Tax=Pisolithus tinctorius Marx 270 TaxID=870435 RepID=A0A0C3J6Q4_PISTI|nr:hypothetical protein BKA82DRAFT_1000254 [Pisolithus tinctorius]KIO04723.1 hypothetical protein M404DRAFT_1000254 [Pisolithus tinctorius Marx 270]
MDIFWPPNRRLSLSDILRSDPRELAVLDDADSDCDHSAQMSPTLMWIVDLCSSLSRAADWMVGYTVVDL